MADIDYDKLASAIAKGQGNSATGSGGLGKGTTDLDKSFSTLSKSMNPLGEGSNALSAAFGKAKDVVGGLEAVIKPNLDTWRQLSATGANFDNDIVSMAASAAGARLNLGEFSDLVKNNAKNFTALGANVAQGAKEFAGLSKQMADSGAVDQLKAIGMTSKDANDMLALAIGNQYTVNMNDAKSRERMIQSATSLATEMDLMSKLTGKTRQEQEDNIKKAQADAQFEAKLRLETLNMNEEEAQKYRQEVMERYNKAQVQGMGDVFKQVYATGTVQTEEAAGKAAILGEQFQATVRETEAIKRKDYEAANAAQKDRDAAIAKDSMDRNKLQLATLGDATAASKTFGENMMNNATFAKGYQKTMEDLDRQGKLQGLNESQRRDLALQTMKSEAEKTQKSDTAGAQSTKALVQLESRAQDVNSAFMNSIVKPVNEKLGPSFQKLNESVLNSAGTMKDANGKVMSKVQELETGMKKGGEAASGPKQTGRTFSSEAEKNNTAGESTVYGAGKLAGGVTTEVANAVNNLVTGKRHTGTSGQTGQAVEPQDAIVKIAKGEMVLDPGQVANMAKQVSAGAAALDAGKGINLGDIGKMVSTTISAASGPAGAKTAEMEQGASDKELESIKERLLDRTNKVIALQKLASERELTEEEKSNLTIAQNGVRRAENNLKSHMEEVAKQVEYDNFFKDAKNQLRLDEIAEVKKTTEAVKEAKAVATVEAVKQEKESIQAKGKLPPFLEQLNAQIKDIKPVEIKSPTPTAAKNPKTEVKPVEKKQETKPAEPKKEEKKPAATVQEVTLKDVHTSLEHLNKSMAQILSYSKTTADAAQAQVKATKGLSGNKFA